MRFAILFAFFFSGFAALVLENIWVRMMSLVFGGSTLAIVTVLTSFMGGIALGSYAAGRLSARIERPIAAYGVLECVVALYSLCLPALIGLLPHLYAFLPDDLNSGLVSLVRFGVCTLLLLLPTTMMGATLPVLSQYFVQDPEDIGAQTGLLYGMNTLGAVAGALVGGFVLLPAIGHHRSLWAVALGLGALGLLMWRLGKDIPNAAQNPDAADAVDEAPQEQRFQRGILGILCVTGGLAMVCQVLWSRTLSMIIGSSSYAFSLLLGIFLIGLALGALWGARLLRKRATPARHWFFLLLATAGTLAAGIWMMDLLPIWFARLVSQFPKDALSPALLFGLKALMAGIPIVLPTFFMGAFFPLALALYAQDDEPQVARDVGRVYAANTVGSIIGSVAAGFVVIPLLGLQGGLAACAGIYLLCAWLLLWLKQQKAHPSLAIAIAVCCAALAILPKWNVGWMSLGLFRISVHRFDKDRFSTPGKVLFYKEGINATVSVHGAGKHRSLRINGKTDASNHGDWLTQVGIAALPLLFHKAPKDAVLIGWGSGITAGAALHFPLRSLTALELEPAVVEGARFFSRWNFDPEKDPRLRLLYNDGRNFLAATRKRFDVIISEPSNPWISGMANLFTQEYFQLTRKKLRRGGIFCQWLQFYELSYDNILLILQTLHQVYPHVYVFEPQFASSDKILLASDQPLELGSKEWHKRLQGAKAYPLFASIHARTARDVLRRYMIGGKSLTRFLKSQKLEINTDGHNILEFRAPLDLVRSSTSKDAYHLGQKLRKHQAKWSSGLLYKRPWSPKRWLDEAITNLLYGHIRRAHSALKRARRPAADPVAKNFHWLLFVAKVRQLPMPQKAALKRARQAYIQGAYRRCLEQLAPLATAAHKQKQWRWLWFYAGKCAFERGQYRKSIEYYEIYQALKPKDPPPRRR